MKLSQHEIDEGWRLAMEALDPIERMLRVRIGVKFGYFSTSDSYHMSVMSSIHPILKRSKEYSYLLPTRDVDAGFDWFDHQEVVINRFVQACLNGKQDWPYDSPIGILPMPPLRLSRQEAESGWEIAASTPDPVERAIRVRCGVHCSYSSFPGAATVLIGMAFLLKAGNVEPSTSLSKMAERIEAFVTSCRAGTKTWPYDSPIGVMPDWSNEVVLDIIMRS